MTDSASVSGSTVVLADDGWGDAGRKVLGLHFHRLQARAPGVIAGEDPEEVHGMRVAARRMRAAWRVFGDAYQRDVRRRMVVDLHDVGQRLGRVRDMDVLISLLDAYLAAHPKHAPLELLRADWVELRSAAHRDLVLHLRSASFTRFVAEYAAFLTKDGGSLERADMIARVPVRALFPGRAWHAYGEVLSYAEFLPPADSIDMMAFHQLRIRAKWLRYTLEFARDALGDSATRVIEPIVTLQDHLGEQHDLYEAMLMTREFATGTHGAVEEAALAAFARYLDRSVERYGNRFPRVWQPISGRHYRNRLSGALAQM